MKRDKERYEKNMEQTEGDAELKECWDWHEHKENRAKRESYDNQVETQNMTRKRSSQKINVNGITNKKEIMFYIKDIKKYWSILRAPVLL